MRRRDLIAIVGVAVIAAGRRVANAETVTQKRRVGMLFAFDRSDQGAIPANAEFRAELTRLGWKEGSNITFDTRWQRIVDANDMRGVATELVGSRRDVIFVVGQLGATVLHNLTRSIPVVFDYVVNPVETGLVSSLARPGGNMTGFTAVDASISSKWVQLLKEAAPGVTRMALVFNPDTTPAPYIAALSPWIAAAAKATAIEFARCRVRNDDELEHVLGAFAEKLGGGLIIAGDIFTYAHRLRIAKVAVDLRLPTVFPWKEGAVAGGLVSYGIDVLDVTRRAASYVDRILRGEKAGDLPVQEPSKFDLIANVKTAKVLGLTLPPELLASADEVVE
jgi:putative tryptophan/tyrosine transport system substrate-binding protein